MISGKLFNFIYTNESKIIKVLNIIFGINSLLALICVVLSIGFYFDFEEAAILERIINLTIIIYISQEAFRFFINFILKKLNYKYRIKEKIVAFLLLITLFLKDTIVYAVMNVFPEIDIISISLIYLGLLQLTIIASYIIDLLRNANLSRIKIHPGAITAISFAAVILIGSFLLMLPKSSNPYLPVSYTDALFTSTSAVCVTGLSTVNVDDQFTLTGKVIILLLIQIGGIGVMTLSSFLAVILFGGLSFRVNVMLKDIISEDNLSEITSVLKRISIFTFSIEFIGMLLMYFSLVQDNNYIDFNTIFSAVFHSVSSFCNAGFSIYHSALADPRVSHNYLFLTTMLIMIFIGGIGFLAFSNLFGYIFYKKNKNKNNYRRLTITTKLTFIVSLIMVVGGSFFVFFTESYSAKSWMNAGDKLFHSFFMIISAKTAGFDLSDVNTVSNFTIFFTIITMYIGASPGSTGGGIKNTTVGVLFIAAFNYFRGNDNLHFSNRRIHPSSIQKAQMVLFTTLLVTIISIAILTYFEPNILFEKLVFEVMSAISTTGLTMATTDKLCNISKFVIIFTMYIGRIGVLNFFYTFIKNQDTNTFEYPDEKVIVG